MYLENDDLLFSEGTTVKVRWSPVSIFPMELPDTYTVDIDMLEMNLDTGVWSELYSLASNLPNTGFTDVHIPKVEERQRFEESVLPVVVRVSLSNSSITENGRKRNAASALFRRLGRFALKTIRNAPVRYLRKLARQAIQRGLCEGWNFIQPRNIGNDILNRLPPCPTRIRDIQIPNSGFTEEKLSSILPVIGEIQTEFGELEFPFVGMLGDHLGYTVIDDSFREFFHPNTTNCFHQRVTDP